MVKFRWLALGCAKHEIQSNQLIIYIYLNLIFHNVNLANVPRDLQQHIWPECTHLVTTNHNIQIFYNQKLQKLA